MPHMQPVLAQARETIAASLGIPALELEIQAGKRMSTDEAVAFALDEKKPARREAPVDAKKVTPLSKRELEIARLIADGMSNKEIASRCFLSERTVETHASNILNKLGVNSRVEVAALGRARVGLDLAKPSVAALAAQQQSRQRLGPKAAVRRQTSDEHPRHIPPRRCMRAGHRPGYTRRSAPAVRRLLPRRRRHAVFRLVLIHESSLSATVKFTSAR